MHVNSHDRKWINHRVQWLMCIVLVQQAVQSRERYRYQGENFGTFRAKKRSSSGSGGRKKRGRVPALAHALAAQGAAAQARRERRRAAASDGGARERRARAAAASGPADFLVHACSCSFTCLYSAFSCISFLYQESLGSILSGKRRSSLARVLGPALQSIGGQPEKCQLGRSATPHLKLAAGWGRTECACGLPFLASR